MRILILILLIILTGCSAKPHHECGSTVTSVLNGQQGQVLSVLCNLRSVCEYQVRFNPATDPIDMYEYELR